MVTTKADDDALATGTSHAPRPGETQRAGGAGNLVRLLWENPFAFPAARLSWEETPWLSIR